MRILQVANWYMPEYGYQEYFLADAWQRMGHEVLTIAGTHVYPRSGYGSIDSLARSRKVAAGRYREQDTDVWRLPCLELRTRVFLSTRLGSLVREFAPDTVVVHGVTSPSTLRMARLKGRTRKPFRLVCDDHSISSNTQEGALGRLYYSAFRRAFAPSLLGAVDAFVPISEETLDIMGKRHGIPQSRMTVIPLGVDLRRFQRREASRMAVRQRLGIGADELLLVYAGKLAASKGIDELIDASIHQLQSHAEVKLLVIGSGQQSFVESQKQRVRDAGLGPRITWMPYMPNSELPDYFSAADVGIWPGTESMVILEAAGCELPIVCRATHYHSKRFANDATLLFHDREELHGNITRLIEDKELRRATGLRAREAVASTGWDRVAARFLEV